MKQYKFDDIKLQLLKREDITSEYVSWLNDKEVNRYLMMRYQVPITLEDVINFVESCNAAKRPHWGIFYKGRHIGNVTCSNLNLNDLSADISFLIGNKTFWKKGIAFIAVANVMDFLFKELGLHRVSAGVCEENEGSMNLLRKLGFTQEACFREAALIDGKYLDDLKFGILNCEWTGQGITYPKCYVEKFL